MAKKTCENGGYQRFEHGVEQRQWGDSQWREEETEALKQKGYLEICQRYLDSPATSLKFNKIKRFPSAQWLIRHSSFQTWIQDSPLAFLTIRGNAFTGKSVLMRTAVEWNKENTSTITLYHFFNDAADGAVTKLLQQLLGQLLAQVEELPHEDIYRWSGDISGKRYEELCSPEALKESIKAVIIANKKSLNEKETGIRIFVDGIDEHLDLIQGHDSTAEEMDEHCQPLQILRLLWELLVDTHSAGIDISVCVSRRHMLQYQGLDPPSVNVELEEYTDAEIERMLKSTLTCLSDPKRENVILRLLKLTGTRNFCWAGHAVKEIMRLGADFQPDDVLQLIPAELKNHSDMYKHALAAQTSDESRDQLHRLLQLRLGTMRPLTADEFRHAMAFVEEDKFRHESVLHWEESDRRRSAGKFPGLLHEASGGLLETQRCGGAEP
ncbi:hypothetical protein NLG97_g10812 [Lecanicillium saksenae]|uniref:Uncharacterized protein n=1 Tax=Lecanicillium saksenae TaxID=468837 RepID=A0ACC1QFZ9_9HYPO|nr:hypothetical protein NLG97_g10812 [Lecanicillium saksenae]